MKKLFGLLAIAAALMQAQGQTQQARNPSELKAFLGLSDTQVSGLRQIQQAARTEAQPVRQEIRDKAQKLREMNKNGTGDAAALGQLMVDVRAARQRLEPIRSRAHDQAMALLTPDQKAKLTQLETALQNRREIRQAAGLGLLDARNLHTTRQQRAQRRGRKLV